MSKIAVTRALRLSGTCIDITKIFAYASLRDGRAVDAFTKLGYCVEFTESFRL